MSSLFSIRKKIILITGSTRGLGFMFAEALGKEGARIVLNGRDGSRTEKAVSKLSARGIDVSGYAFDVADREQITRQIAGIEEEIGPIDVLVNNAGIQRRGPLEEIEEKDWHDVIETNLTGAFLSTQQVVRGMIHRQRGKIINICSLMSEVSRPTTGPYTASKGGLKMLTKAMAMEWAGHNIQVNGIGPGYFITEMTESLSKDPEFNSWILSRTPAKRWGTPSDLIGPLLFLASDASRYVTGQILYVDGGILTTI